MGRGGISIGGTRGARVQTAWIPNHPRPSPLPSPGRVPAAFQMLALALTRRIARPQLAARLPAVARWYSSAQTKFSTDGERVIHEKLMEKFKPSELVVEDVSGEFYAAGNGITSLNTLSPYRRLRDVLPDHYSQRGIQGLASGQTAAACKPDPQGRNPGYPWSTGMSNHTFSIQQKLTCVSQLKTIAPK